MVVVQEGIRLKYGDEPFQFGDLYVPADEKRHPVVILIHGGFWRAVYDLSLMTKLAQDLAARGDRSVEYRISPCRKQWRRLAGNVLDVAQATDYVMRIADHYDLDPHQVVALGHSAGGHLALWLATREKQAQDWGLAPGDAPLTLSGVVSLAGAMDLEQVWQLGLGNDAVVELLDGSPDDVPERYTMASPCEHLPLGIEQVLIHGTEDDSVPLVVSQEYADRARQLGDTVKLIKLVGGNHFVVIDPASTAWNRTVEEIKRLLHHL